MTAQTPNSPNVPDAQVVVPYLMYADAGAAIDFLCRAFGFRQRMRYDMDDGRVGHAEVELGRGVVMLASAWADAGMRSPRDLPGVHAQVVVRVDDIDAHHARAVEAGATVIAAPEDNHGERMYRALYVEGHRWVFSQAPSSPARAS